MLVVTINQAKLVTPLANHTNGRTYVLSVLPSVTLQKWSEIDLHVCFTTGSLYEVIVGTWVG